MNIFFTHHCPEIAARNLCMVHVNKMIIESMQILSTAHRVLDNTENDSLMKSTHINHPSSVWVRENAAHYQWLFAHVSELCAMYTKHTNKIHACEKRLDFLYNSPANIMFKAPVEPPRVMSDDLKFDETISNTKAYQMYLKRKYNEWVNREKPIKVVFVYETPSFIV